MIGSEFLKTVLGDNDIIDNVTVQFTREVDRYDCFFDRRMYADVANITETDDVGVFKVVFNVKAHDEHNSRVEEKTYWDGKGNAILSAREAGMHPEKRDWFEDLYLDLNSQVPFVIVPKAEDDNVRYESIASDWLNENIGLFDNPGQSDLLKSLVTLIKQSK